MTTDFSLYETFFEMENKGHHGKFYIIQPWQNWDNWLNKPVSHFDFGADINRDILIKFDISIANNSEFRLKFYKNCNILMRLRKGRLGTKF